MTVHLKVINATLYSSIISVVVLGENEHETSAALSYGLNIVRLTTV
jgi:hypothetical protein